MSQLPIAVDLDGSLVRTDTLHELALALLRTRPLDVLLLPFWLARGKAHLKHAIASRVGFDAATLPYNEPLLAWLKQQKSAGRRLVLCTGADGLVAHAVAHHLGIFDQVLVSADGINLAGSNKRRALEREFGPRGFDYVGNADIDLDVWGAAHAAVVVSPSASLAARASQVSEVLAVFREPLRLRTVGKALRVHQWIKNLLLFVPLIAAHQLGDPALLAAALVAFVSFSLCASGVYVANDLMDLESDRAHPRKRHRPFASGALPIASGMVLAPALMLAGFSLAVWLGADFAAWLAAYLALTAAYSARLKRLLLVDCVVLALLYTLRVVAGAAATGIELSFWLLAFAVFLFFSLAFVKRYVELRTLCDRREATIRGRGYIAQDVAIVQAIGIASGYAAVVILSLYLQGDTVRALYRRPEAMWGAVLLMLFWISWVWMKASRGEVDDDPVVFAAKDLTSLLVGLGIVACFVAAKLA
ncbi:MAG TPA: UbiA family prenyltransferase [Ramlibacter sp.]|jgi:4-hydroxybenzoate polyprenyltransferase|uniref:UbiA family prenyltransferase n=1 Tax=Ramlibacter sp. TaxID=1917967 RepID=UPI002D320508|nr:UbiA family prenyltransferase [Ramlibacter sp.]HZY18407.1 UbiA family prenyltransferase [Ramlibacter sp.]